MSIEYDFSKCDKEDMETFFTFDWVDKMTEEDLADEIKFLDDTASNYICVDKNGNVLTEQDYKERRLYLKRKIARRQVELGMLDDEMDIAELLGYGHYRKDKGYNKYHEWRCSKCKQYKPRTVEYFPKDRKRRNGLGYICRECLKDYSRQRYQSKRKTKNTEESEKEEQK